MCLAEFYHLPQRTTILDWSGGPVLSTILSGTNVSAKSWKFFKGLWFDMLILIIKANLRSKAVLARHQGDSVLVWTPVLDLPTLLCDDLLFKR